MAASASVGESTICTEMKSKASENFVAIRVKSQDGRETHFKIRRDTKMKKLLLAYCQKYFLDFDATHFYLEGQHFNHNKTPDQLGMENDVEIESMADQLGGGHMSSSLKMAD